MSNEPQTVEEAPVTGAGRAATSELSQVTHTIVAIYKEQFGRGPVHAHSYWAGPDTIVCLLEGTLTPVERTLVNLGEQQRLQDLRQLFQSRPRTTSEPQWRESSVAESLPS